MAIRGVLNLIFKANTTQAKKGVSSLGKAMDRVGKEAAAMRAAINGLANVGAMLATAGVAAGTAIGALSVNAASNARETQKWADALGIGAKRLDAMEMAAAKFGVEGDQVADSMKDLGIKIDLALKEGGGITDLFKIAGIQLNKFKGMSNDEKLFTFFDELKKLDPETARTLMDEINDSMFQLGPIVNDRTVDFRKLTQEVEASGRVMSNAQRGALLALNSSFVNLKQSMSAATDQLGSKMAPALQTIFDAVGSRGPMLFDKLIGAIHKMGRAFVGAFSVMHSAFKWWSDLIGVKFQSIGKFWDEYIFKPLQTTINLLSTIGSTGDVSALLSGDAWREAQANATGLGLEKLMMELDKPTKELFGDLNSSLDNLFKATTEGNKATEKLNQDSKPKGEIGRALNPLNLSAQQINPNQIRLGGDSQRSLAAEQLAQQKRIAAATERTEKLLRTLSDNPTQGQPFIFGAGAFA